MRSAGQARAQSDDPVLLRKAIVEGNGQSLSSVVDQDQPNLDHGESGMHGRRYLQPNSRVVRAEALEHGRRRGARPQGSAGSLCEETVRARGEFTCVGGHAFSVGRARKVPAHRGLHVVVHVCTIPQLFTQSRKFVNS